MKTIIDGPASDCFSPLSYTTGFRLEDLSTGVLSEGMSRASSEAPRGNAVAWGIPLDIQDIVVVKEKPVSVALTPLQAEWLVFMQTADERPMELNAQGIASPTRGEGQLNEHAADY